MDMHDFLRAAVALLFTLSLMGVIAWAIGRFGRNLPGWAQPAGNGRLAVVERRMIDTRHQLILVRRDQREHLVLLSSQSAPLLVESGITPPTASGAPTP